MGGVGGGIGERSGVEKKEQILVPDGLLLGLHNSRDHPVGWNSSGGLLKNGTIRRHQSSGGRHQRRATRQRGGMRQRGVTRRPWRGTQVEPSKVMEEAHTDVEPLDRSGRG